VADDAPTRDQVFSVPTEFAKTARVNAAGYRAAYQQALSDPDGY
jgi:hypothetical protein